MKLGITPGRTYKIKDVYNKCIRFDTDTGCAIFERSYSDMVVIDYKVMRCRYHTRTTLPRCAGSIVLPAGWYVHWTRFKPWSENDNATGFFHICLLDAIIQFEAMVRDIDNQVLTSKKFNS